MIYDNPNKLNFKYIILANGIQGICINDLLIAGGGVYNLGSKYYNYPALTHKTSPLMNIESVQKINVDELYNNPRCNLSDVIQKELFMLNKKEFAILDSIDATYEYVSRLNKEEILITQDKPQKSSNGSILLPERAYRILDCFSDLFESLTQENSPMNIDDLIDFSATLENLSTREV